MNFSFPQLRVPGSPIVKGGVLVLLIGVIYHGNAIISFVTELNDNVTTLFQAGQTVAAALTGTDKIKPNDITAKQVQALQQASDCSFNPEEWKDGSGTLVLDKEGVYRIKPNSISSTMQYYRSVSSESTVTFVLTPQTPLVNFAMVFHDFFEIVVGDGDVYGATLKANLGNPDKMQFPKGKGRLTLYGGIKTGTDVTVTVAQKPLADGSHEVFLRIRYTSSQGITKDVSEFYNFPIPSEFQGTEEPIRMSVGFVNTQSSQEIGARFKCFRISSAEVLENLSLQK